MSKEDVYWRRISELEETMDSLGFNIVEYEEDRMIFRMSNPGPEYNQVYCSAPLAKFQVKSDYEFDIWMREFITKITGRIIGT